MVCRAWAHPCLQAGAVAIWLAAAGLMEVLVPAEAVRRYLGPGTPWRGILMAWLIGTILPGAPYVALPLAAALLSRGAGIAAASTLVLSASLVSVTRLPYEVAFVGWRFAVLRTLACAGIPPVAGLLVHWLNVTLRLYPTA